MDGLEWKTLLKWMIWAYPYFRKTSNYSFLCFVIPNTRENICFISDRNAPKIHILVEF